MFGIIYTSEVPKEFSQQKKLIKNFTFQVT